MKTTLGPTQTTFDTAQQRQPAGAVTPSPIQGRPTGQPSITPNLPPVGQVGGVPNAPAPSTEPLTAEQLKSVAGVGGAGLSGSGTLTGQIGAAMVRQVDFGIATQVEKPVLITANAGRDDQVHFVLDLPKEQVAALKGQQASISGQIEKGTDHVGKITGAELGEVSGFAPGSYARLQGRVEERNEFGIGGEAPPSGNWLVLAQPIQVDGQAHGAIFLGHAPVQAGAEVDLNGRLDPKSWGGVERPRTPYVELSGVTNPGAGEPLYDGRTFTSSASGKTLDVISYNRPLIADAPARIWVLDPGQDKAFMGAQGGFIPREVNPFHGFRGHAEMRPPTAAEQRSVEFRGDTPVDKATGTKLELVHHSDMPDGVADGMATSWYLNPRTDTVYRFQNGGIAGFRNHMDQILKPAAAE